MPTGRPKPALELTPDKPTQLRSLAASRTLPHALVSRAKLVLWWAQGRSNSQIADRLDWTKPPSVSGGSVSSSTASAGCTMSCGQDRPRSIEEEQIAGLLQRTLSRMFIVLLSWSVEEVARVNLSHDAGKRERRRKQQRSKRVWEFFNQKRNYPEGRVGPKELARPGKEQIS